MKMQNMVIAVLVLLAILGVGAGLIFFARNNPKRIGQSVSGTVPTVSDLNRRLKICEAIPNGAAQEVIETTRLFINLPEDIYPFANRQFTSNGATAGLITNGEGLPPQRGSLETFIANKCATHYYEFSGLGSVDLEVKSAVPEVPDYNIHFKVKGEGNW